MSSLFVQVRFGSRAQLEELTLVLLNIHICFSDVWLLCLYIWLQWKCSPPQKANEKRMTHLLHEHAWHQCLKKKKKLYLYAAHHLSSVWLIGIPAQLWPVFRRILLHNCLIIMQLCCTTYQTLENVNPPCGFYFKTDLRCDSYSNVQSQCFKDL